MIYFNYKLNSYFAYMLHKLEQSDYKDLYIYGIGQYAKRTADFLMSRGYTLSGFIDDGNGDTGVIQVGSTLPIYSTKEISDKPKTIVIASKDHAEEIFKRLMFLDMKDTEIIRAFQSAPKPCEFSNVELKHILEKNEIRSIFFVADNTDTANFGCRATSFALMSLLSEEFKISGSIKRNELNELFAAIEGYDDIFNYYGAIKRYNEDVYRNIKNRMAEADAVVINGEGSFIFRPAPRTDMMNMLVLCLIAIDVQRPFFIINSLFSDYPGETINEKTLKQTLRIFQYARLIVARDKTSYEFIKKRNNIIELKCIPDAVFSAYDECEKNKSLYSVLKKDIKMFLPFSSPQNMNTEFNLENPFALLSGNSYAARYQMKAEYTFCILAEKLQIELGKHGIGLILIECCDGDSFIKDVAMKLNMPCIPASTNIKMVYYLLGLAKVFISGRYHPSIMASLGGTPCVFMSGNSHKTSSLQHMLEYKEIVTFDPLPNDEETQRIVAETEHKINMPREPIKQVCKGNSVFATEVTQIFNESIN